MFSVLLSVYHRERPEYLHQALSSIWDHQTLKPTQIVLVKDGPLNVELDSLIYQWIARLGDILKIVALPENVGLAKALNHGLNYCDFNLVARMDTDDIAVEDRFKLQIEFMVSHPEVSVSSGFIEEWSQDYSHILSIRYLPIDHESISKFAKKRSPISHPAVIFRKEAVLQVGGYPEIYPEDYPLWVKMIVEGYKFANIPKILVKMRVGNALTERRGKLFLMGEIKVFDYIYSLGFINRYEYYRNILLRSLLRLSPVFVKKIMYKFFR